MRESNAIIAIVDDDPSVREGLESLLRSAGWRVETFASAQEFLARPGAEAPCCLILDLQLPGLSGLDLQKRMAEVELEIPIVFLTGHGDIPASVQAMKAGAVEFLTKPFDDEELLQAIQQCIRWHRGEEIRCAENLGNMVGESPEFKRVLEAIEVVAPTEAAVLIQGETGTGKELVAHAIHDQSSRSRRSFIEVNCAAIPATLLESELFGHEKGAFTGAIAQKMGRFERAHQGTLFLDEIGEIPLELQPKLLRALQEQEFERLGGNRTIRVDIRIIAATNRNLKQMVDEGKFRSDLYYRLNVFPLTVPPLRERREDIELLIRFFTQRSARKLNRAIEEIPATALEALTRYDWPGNIRELQNVIERSVILSPGPELRIAMPEFNRELAPVVLVGRVANGSEDVERARILEALKEAKGQVSGPDGAAARLGLKRTTLQSRMQKYKIARQFQ